MFLYGTLREGEDLAVMLPRGKRHKATVSGRLHYSPHTMAYPVLLPSLELGDVAHGEVGWFDLHHRDVADVLLMEIEAGYSATWADVTLDDGSVVSALTFTWHPHDGCGPPVRQGDWTIRTVHECTECGAFYGTENEAVECEWQHDDEDERLAEMAYAMQKENA